MILGLGTDIVENDRIAALYKKHKKRFLTRIYTDEEIAYAEEHIDPVPHLAARFAAKEAFIKCLNLTGKNLNGISMKDVEVAGKNFGKKRMRLSGKTKKHVEKMGGAQIHLSISHTDTFSMAVVILEKPNES
ncbi:MAG: holo-ACP synthase [Spirochaetia bacterium]|nr:holo-ACP synthase [Spirochaetia bacterium]